MFKPIRTFIKTPIPIWTSQVVVTWSEPHYFYDQYVTDVRIDENTFKGEIFDMPGFKVALEKVEYDSFYYLDENLFLKNDYSNDLELIELLKKPIKYFQVSDYENGDIVYEIDADKLSIHKESEVFIDRQYIRKNYQNDETLIAKYEILEEKETVGVSLKINDIKKIYSLFGDSINFLLKRFSDIILGVSIYEKYNLNFEKVLLYYLDIDLKSNLSKFNTNPSQNPNLYKIKDIDKALLIKLNNDKIIHVNENHYFVDCNQQKVKGSDIDGLVHCTYHKFTFDLLMTIKFYKYLPKIFLITKNEDFGYNYNGLSNKSEIYNCLNIDTYDKLINILSDDHWYRKQLQKQKQKFEHKQTMNEYDYELYYGKSVYEEVDFTIEEKLTMALNYYFHSLIQSNKCLEFLSNIIFKIISVSNFYEIKIIINGKEYALEHSNKVNQEIIFILNLLLFQITYQKDDIQNILYIDETVFNFKNPYTEGVKIELDKICNLKNMFLVVNTHNSNFVDLDKDNYLIDSNNISIFKNTFAKDLLTRIYKNAENIVLINNNHFFNILCKIRQLNNNINCSLINVTEENLQPLYLNYFKNLTNDIKFVKVNFDDNSVQVKNTLNYEEETYYIDIMDLVPRDLFWKTYEELYGQQTLLSKVPNYVQISTFIKYWKAFSDNYNKKGNYLIIDGNSIEFDMFSNLNLDDLGNYSNYRYLSEIFYIKKQIALIINKDNSNLNQECSIYNYKYNLEQYQKNYNINLINDFNSLFKINLIVERDDRFPSRFKYNDNFISISEKFSYKNFTINLIKNLSDKPLTELTTEMTAFIKKIEL